ncbi:MAG: hypothetical protein QM770_06895 [Tepidisphaeraceae bacterium]
MFRRCNIRWRSSRSSTASAQVHKQGDRIAIYTRTLDRIDANFPDVVAQLRNVEGDVLIDGEILAWRDGRALPFANVQKRLGRIRHLATAVKKHPCTFIAFDVLYAQGELLLDRPYRERRATLTQLGVQPVIDSHQANEPDDIVRAFETSRVGGNEGLILKELDSPYKPGKRGTGWLKLKTHLPTLDCVVTYAELGHGKRRGTLSDYTFAVWSDAPAKDGATLLNIGKAYSGVTDAEIAELTERFMKDSIETDGRVHRVKPSVVLEIAFDQIQKSNRHDSGYALRFPRIKTIRRDKKIEDADRIGRVIELYEHTENMARDAESPTVDPQGLLF